ncbi:MAG TPA: peptidoglycan DD-metalloendopeptidase family protein [Ilumatobacteraceae bacterium]|nr:peptidoglycan DD-metalloendopeptidase family protein [Ilumatobacteraceae bacterium]
MSSPAAAPSTALAVRWRAAVWTVALVLSLVTVPVLGANRTEGAPAAVTCPGASYVVVSGDSWSRIASRAGVTMTALLQANNATTAKVIHPGDVLCLPAGATNTTSSTTTTVSPSSVAIAQFPVQGLCWFSDSFAAPRSGGRSHEGVDILAALGNKVYAVDDGVLTKQYLDTPGALAGNGWRLTRADGTYFFYAHLSAFAPGLAVGSTVKAGQIIGLIGMTGNAGANHLHFEVHPGGGAAINPTPVVAAVNGCRSTKVPVQPGDTTTTSSTTTTVAATTTTIKPASTTSTTSTTTTAPARAALAGPGLWQSVSPSLVLDTTLPANTSRTVNVGSVRGVPSTTNGVMVRVVVVRPTANGSVTLSACAGGAPTSVTMNYAPSRMNATMTTTAVTGGTFCVRTTSAAWVRVDIVGYESASGMGVSPVVARRVVDTKAAGKRLVAGQTLTVSPAKLALPADAAGVTATFTVVSPSVSGQLYVGACGGTLWRVGYTKTSPQVFSVITKVGAAGLCVKTTATLDLTVDVTGVWGAGAPLTAAAPVRLFDSRSGAPITAAQQQVVVAVPAGATRAQLTVGLLSKGSLYLWNCATAQPSAPVVSTASAPSSVTVTVDVTGGKLCLASTGSAQATLDLVAYG